MVETIFEGGKAAAIAGRTSLSTPNFLQSAGMSSEATETCKNIIV